MLKYIYITCGTISLVLGIIGIVTPGLPTTPFLLLTAFLYGKSSPKLYHKLVNHKITGAYINKVNKGLSIKARLISIGFMWLMISITIFLVFKNDLTMQIVMFVLGIIGTIAQIIILGKKNKQDSKPEEINHTEEDLNTENIDIKQKIVNLDS